jgi:hypothetical protein
VAGQGKKRRREDEFSVKLEGLYECYSSSEPLYTVLLRSSVKVRQKGSYSSRDQLAADFRLHAKLSSCSSPLREVRLINTIEIGHVDLMS